MVLAAWLFTGWGGERLLTWVSDLASMFGALAATVACALAARRRSAERRSWALLALAAASWTAGEVLWNIDELVRGEELPFPSVADVFYLAAVVPALLGLIGFGQRVPRARQARILLDGTLMASALTFLAWALVIGDAWEHGAPLLTQAVSAAYPITDVALATVAALVVLWGRSPRRAPVRLLAAAFVAMAVADTAFTWSTNNGTYASTATIGSLWAASYVLLALAARHPAEPAMDDDAGDRPMVEGLAATVLPYVPFGLAMVVAVARWASGRQLDGVLGPLAFVLVVALLARQALAVAENRRLAVDLELTVQRVEEQSRALEHLAWHDALTGLPNRARFSSRLEAVLEAQAATGGTLPAVLYIDLDGFKQVNDSLGHATGDLALVQASSRLAACLGPGTMLARLGGDEFVILVEAGLDEATRIAFRTIDAFQPPFLLEDQPAAIGISVGIADAPDADSPDEVVRRADAAMYAAKCGGKGRVVLYPSDIIATAGD